MLGRRTTGLILSATLVAAAVAVLLPLAVTNLHRRYPGAEVHRSDGFGMLTGSGDLESSCWTEEAARFHGELVASVPSRDVMVWCDSSVERLVTDLETKGAEIVQEEQTMNCAISSLLYVWRGGQWQVWEPAH